MLATIPADRPHRPGTRRIVATFAVVVHHPSARGKRTAGPHRTARSPHAVAWFRALRSGGPVGTPSQDSAGAHNANGGNRRSIPPVQSQRLAQHVYLPTNAVRHTPWACRCALVTATRRVVRCVSARAACPLRKHDALARSDLGQGCVANQRGCSAIGPLELAQPSTILSTRHGIPMNARLRFIEHCLRRFVDAGSPAPYCAA